MNIVEEHEPYSISDQTQQLHDSLFTRAQYQLDKLHSLVEAKKSVIIFSRHKADLESLVTARQSNRDVVGRDMLRFLREQLPD